MKPFFLLFILSISTYTIAQTGKLQTANIDTNFSWHNSTLTERDSFYFNMPIVKYSKYKTHFRISLSNQTIDLFSNNNISFQGLLTNKIIAYKLVKTDLGETNKANHYVFQKIEIDSVLSTTIANKLLLSEQYNIPTDDLIPHWTKWYLHCGGIRFQFKLDDSYSEQSFHCPWSQPDTIMYVDIITSNYKLIKEELDLEKHHDDFFSLLPKGCTYSRDGSTKMYKLTETEIESLARGNPRREHLKSIKDTVDNYIKSELKKQNIELNGMSCFKPYYIIYDKNGDLKKVDILNHQKPKLSDGLSLYLEEKRELRKCKKLVKRVFKKIDLSGFDLRYGIRRIVSFVGEGELKFYDNTKY